MTLRYRGAVQPLRLSDFATELGKALEHNDMNVPELAVHCGVSSNAIYLWLRGIRRPTMAAAARAAEILNWPRLVTVSAKDRRRRCIVCNRQYVSLAKNPSHGRFCGTKCQQTWHARQQRGNRESIAFARLREHQAAVEAMCRSCEPADLICRNNGCPLRGVSPLPFIPIAEVRVPYPLPRKREAAA